MRPAEQGFLLLTSHLGDPERKVLTVAQLRDLAGRAKDLDITDPNRNMQIEDLVRLGYAPDMAQRILRLLDDKELLEYYLHRGARQGCQVLTRVSDGYPMQVRAKLGLDSPGCLWAKGDITLLGRPSVSAVGSRDLRKANRDFAREVGVQAAKQGYVLVSGNARGADTVAQEACLAAGGCVISVVADDLRDHKEQENVLCLSEDSFDMPFSSQRALSRNRVIHGLGIVTLVAQSGLNGGTWDGTVKNLKQNISPVFCFADGSQAMQELCNLGATAVTACDLADLSALKPNTPNFIDQ